MAISRVTQGQELFRPAADPWSIDGVASPGATDVQILGIVADGNPTINAPPSGFVQFATVLEPADDFETFLFWGVGQAGPYSVDWAATTAGVGWWLSYSGVDTGDAIDVPAGIVSSGGTLSTVVDTPFILPVSDGAMIVGHANTESTVATTMTWDGGITEVIDFNDVGAAPGFLVCVGERLWAAGSGDVSIQGDISTSRNTTRATFALRPGDVLKQQDRSRFPKPKLARS